MKKYIGFLIVLSVLVGFSSAQAVSNSVVQKGAKSAEVKTIQTVLKNQGYTINPDGIFGAKTEDVVKKFQAAKGLTVTGIIDANTKSVIDSITAINLAPAPVPVSQVGKYIPQAIVAPAVKPLPRVIDPTGGKTMPPLPTVTPTPVPTPLPVVIDPNTKCALVLLSKNTSYANRMVNPHTPNFKIGSFNIANNCNEPVRITNLNVGIVQSAFSVPTSDLSNLFVKDVSGNALNSQIQPTYDNNIAVDFTVNPGITFGVSVYADIGTSISGTIQTSLDYKGVGTTTGLSFPVLSSVNHTLGQVITVGNANTIKANSAN